MDKLIPAPLERCGPGRVSWCSASRTSELIDLPGGMVFVPLATLVMGAAQLVRVEDPKASFIAYLIAGGYRAPEKFALGNNVKQGKHCAIGGEGFGFHKGVRFPHIGSLEIGDDVDMGSCVCIDRGTLGNTVVGARTKIGNLVHIAHNAQIGEDCLIVDRVGIAGSAVIGNGCFIGYGATILKVRIGDGATIGAHALVTKDVPAGETWAGVPASKMEAKPTVS